MKNRSAGPPFGTTFPASPRFPRPTPPRAAFALWSSKRSKFRRCNRCTPRRRLRRCHRKATDTEASRRVCLNPSCPPIIQSEIVVCGSCFVNQTRRAVSRLTSDKPRNTTHQEALLMDCSWISPVELPGTTDLYSGYLCDFPRVANFYIHPPNAKGIADAVRQIHLDDSVRRGVVDVLREQNRAFGGDDSTAQSLDRLRDGAVAVVTGQQVGLFGGPAYSVYKALTAVHVARELTASGTNAVPVFWLATEDHDLAEVNHCIIPKRGAFERFDLSVDGPADRRVGDIRLGEPVREIAKQIGALLSGPCAEKICQWIEECYAPEETFGSAFGKLMTRIFAGRGLIFLDPMSPQLHRLALPAMRAALKDHVSLAMELVPRSEALEKAGFHAQVKVTEQSTLLFRIVDGQRLPLRPANGGLLAGNKAGSIEETLWAMEERREDFSPSALLRPVI